MNFDVVVLGGGLVGASLLCALKNQDLKLALIDKAPVSQNSETNLDARALALSSTSVACLNMIGVWPKVAMHASPILKIHVSKKGYFGSDILEAKSQHLSNFGCVVNADFLNNAINQTVQESNNTHIFRPESITSLKKENKHWQIQLSSKKEITAKLLVAADGSASYFRQQQGIGVKITDRGLAAIVVNIQLAQSHQGIAYERFIKEGSIAMLPFGGKKVKAVWIGPTLAMEKLKLCKEAEFLNELQENFGYRLGNFIQLGSRIIYPLQTVYAEAIYGGQWILIGNAANTVYPIAAQGFNLGLRDAAFLAEELAMAKKEQQDFTSIHFLQHYADLRLTDHQQIKLGTGVLLESPSFQWLGILACQWIAPFKRRVIKWGLGKQDCLPKLCRGIAL